MSVSRMLLVGVTLAAGVVLIGGLLYVRHPWVAIPDYSHFSTGGATRTTIAGVIDGLVHLNPKSIIEFGLLLLIATPVARVVFCVIGFARQKDKLYVLISSVVLVILLYSLTKGVR
jgi:uncharacterized membrane protein